MANKRRPKISQNRVRHALSQKNETTPQKNGLHVQNGLCEALGFPWSGGNGGFMGVLGGPNGGLPGFPGGWGAPQQVSDTTTIFDNLRWYFISNFRQVLSQAYCEIGLIKTIVDVPVDDGLRGGVTIQSRQLDELQIDRLKTFVDRNDDLNKMGYAAKWTRLFGGGGVLVIVGDQDPEEPLDIKAIGPQSQIEFRAVDMWELFWDQMNVSLYESYEPNPIPVEFEFYDYYSHQVHRSRVFAMKGMEAPSFVRPRFRGWGISVVEMLVRSINQYLKGTDLMFEVLDEFKVDVYKIKNLTDTLMNPNGTTQVQQRIQLANWQKNFQNALVMDGEDDWDHKQLSFDGLDTALTGIRKQVAADMRMPVSKLFGASDANVSIGTADQNDMENYNSMVENEVRAKLKFDILRMLEIRCQQLFGFIPTDLSIDFEPLHVLTAEEEEKVKDSKWKRIKEARELGELNAQEFRDACNKGNLFDLKLDTSPERLSEIEAAKSTTIGAEGRDEVKETDTEKEPPYDPSGNVEMIGKKEKIAI